MDIKWRDQTLQISIMYYRITTPCYKSHKLNTPQQVLSRSVHMTDTSAVIFPRGGVTCVSTRYRGKWYEVSAVCSIKDNFNRTIGRTISVGRLLHLLNEDYPLGRENEWF